MAFVDKDPWDLLLLPYVEKMTPAQDKELGGLMSRPIIDWYMWIDDKGEVHYASDPDSEVEQ